MDSSWFYTYKHYGKKFTKIQVLEKGQIKVSIHISPYWPNPIFLLEKSYLNHFPDWFGMADISPA